MTRSDSVKGKKTSSKQAPSKPTQGKNEQADLMRRINEAQQLVQDLKNELRARKSGGGGPRKLPPRIPLWVIVRDHLRDAGGEDSIPNIIEALLGAGHDLGKYPLRNIKTMVVSIHMRDTFEVSKLPNGTEMVKLVEGTAAYTPGRYRRQS